MTEEKCIACDVGAAAKVLIDEYCLKACEMTDGKCKDSCERLLTEMVEKNWSLKNIAQKVGAKEEDIAYFEEQGLPVERGIQDLLLEE